MLTQIAHWIEIAAAATAVIMGVWTARAGRSFIPQRCCWPLAVGLAVASALNVAAGNTAPAVVAAVIALMWVGLAVLGRR